MNSRLKQFLAAENISQSQFADTINVVRASVSHVLSGRNKPGYDFIKAIMTAYPHLNMEWLMIGKGKMYKSGEGAASIATETPLLFFDDETDDMQVYDDIKPNTQVQEQQLISTDSLASEPQNIINQRKAIKVIIFFDDGTFQEM